MERFKDKVAVVTGGNSGIGLATAKAFAREGAGLAITGRNDATLDAARKEPGPGTYDLKIKSWHEPGGPAMERRGRPGAP